VRGRDVTLEGSGLIYIPLEELEAERMTSTAFPIHLTETHTNTKSKYANTNRISIKNTGFL